MADSSPISSSYTGAIYDSTASKSTKTTGIDSGIGMDAFLKMFMAQVTNQNPLDPMDNTEFTAQLATFSQLEQLTKINESMSSLANVEKAITNSQMVSYIGKEVTMSGDTLVVSNGTVGSTSFQLGANANNVKALIIDSAGKTVADIDLGAMEAGAGEFQWDGTDSAGQKVADGLYRVSITAYTSQGDLVSVSDQQVSGLVTGIQNSTDGTSSLLMGKTAVPLSNILAVKQPSSSTTTSEEESSLISTLGTLATGLAALL